MKRCLIPIVFLIFFYGCKTVDDSNNDQPIIYEQTSSENEIVVTQEDIEIYDLTVLKGGSYPTIKNDSPFTQIELDILKTSSGLEKEASIEVAHYFKYFLRDKRELLELWVENSRPVIPYIKEEFKKNNLPLELIYLPFLESGYNPMAYSRVGAGGIWQFMPRTARSYGLRINWWIDERRSPQLATPYAIKHLRYLYQLFGNWYTALAAYNAGEGRISRAMDKVEIYDYFELIKTEALPKETRKYVPQYLAIVKIMKNLDKLGFEKIEWETADKNYLVTIPGGTDLYNLSYKMNLEWEDFKNMNPSFRRQVSDPSYKSKIVIPMDKKDLCSSYLENVKPITFNGHRNYIVKKGDTWSILSQQTNVEINSLKRLNSITTNRLKVGQKLLMPKSRYLVDYVPKPKSDNLQKYIVKRGDTISSISIRYNIKLSALYKVNNLNSYSILKIGQVVKLPGYPLGEETLSNEHNSIHKVVYGDTLSGISYKYNVSLKRLMIENGINDPGNIKIGDKIRIPGNNYYTVKYGDSVWLIAQKNKIPYKKLLSINNLNSNSRLQIGDKIRLY